LLNRAVVKSYKEERKTGLNDCELIYYHHERRCEVVMERKQDCLSVKFMPCKYMAPLPITLEQEIKPEKVRLKPIQQNKELFLPS